MRVTGLVVCSQRVPASGESVSRYGSSIAVCSALGAASGGGVGGEAPGGSAAGTRLGSKFGPIEQACQRVGQLVHAARQAECQAARAREAGDERRRKHVAGGQRALGQMLRREIDDDQRRLAWIDLDQLGGAVGAGVDAQIDEVEIELQQVVGAHHRHIVGADAHRRGDRQLAILSIADDHPRAERGHGDTTR
ncbi:hypothetical protein HC891_18995 [Candidatus Gracilibacteria bacterium]|nr:hypothetical protein [Candidatus Gracilibacteria bacterium]